MEVRLGETLDFACEEVGLACVALALRDGLGRLADEAPADGRLPALTVDGAARFAALGWVETLAEPELHPRACWLPAEADAEGLPLLLTRLWSGCQRCADAVLAEALDRAGGALALYPAGGGGR